MRNHNVGSETLSDPGWRITWLEGVVTIEGMGGGGCQCFFHVNTSLQSCLTHLLGASRDILNMCKTGRANFWFGRHEQLV